MNKKFLKHLAWLLAAAMTNAAALSTDREQPIEIEADTAEADDGRGVTIYTGDVVIVQGTMHINGDVVTIYFDGNQDITKVVAEGEPAKFKQQPDGSTDFQHAEAKTLEFHTADDTIVMLGNAVSWQGDNRIEAEKIVYDTRVGKVKADSVRTIVGAEDGTDTEGGSSRVKITIAPKKQPQPEEQ